MQDSNFDRLLHRYLHNEMTPGEAAKFTAWLDLLEKDNNQDLEMTAEAKEALFQKISSNISTIDEVVALYPRRSLAVRLFSYRWIQVAATVVFILLGTYVVRYYGTGDYTSDRALTSFEKMILNDGTIVWMKGRGEFSYYEKDGARFANFSGEALFEVAKDPDIPFTISCGRIAVNVLGTSFALKTDADQIELKVLTGKVKVTSESDTEGIDVNPNEILAYTADGVVGHSLLTPDDREFIIAHTEYNMEFRRATVDKVARSIEKKFDVKVTIKNDNLKKCHISADFSDQSLEQTLSILADLLDVSYRITGKTVELSGSGC